MNLCAFVFDFFFTIHCLDAIVMIDFFSVHDRLLEMAKSVCSILESHSIPYFISYGTLLGAIRHRGFIPWDDDLDIYLFDDSYDKAIAAIKQELPKRFFVEDKETEPLYFHGWAHVKDLNSHTVCDLFPQDNLYHCHGLCIDLYKATKIPREQLELFQLKERKAYLTRKLSSGFISQEDYSQKIAALDPQIASLEKNEVRNPTDLIYGFMSLPGDSIDINDVFPLKRYQFEDTLFWGPNEPRGLLTRCYGNYMELPPEDKRHPHYSKVVFLDENSRP